jgi:sulfur-oxidizing protein SoxZ
MAARRIVIPATARKGDVVQIKTLIQHVMETGFRRDNEGRVVARDIVNRLTVTYAGEEIFRFELFPGISANPYIEFTTIATETGDLVFSWLHDSGEVTTETRRLAVSG